MTYARYYFKRTTATPTSQPPLLFTTTGYEWAMIRGADRNGQRLSGIDFQGTTNRAALTAIVTATDGTLAESQYEIVLGTSGESPTDQKFRPPSQPTSRDYPAVQVTIPNIFVAVAEEDPPPPPSFDWNFGPVVDLR